MSSPEVKCTCYPGGVTPDTYEGPQPWCDVHGQPSAAYDAGYKAALEAIEWQIKLHQKMPR